MKIATNLPYRWFRSCTMSCFGPGVTIAGCEFSTWWCDVCTEGNKPGENRNGKSLWTFGKETKRKKTTKMSETLPLKHASGKMGLVCIWWWWCWCWWIVFQDSNDESVFVCLAFAKMLWDRKCVAEFRKMVEKWNATKAKKTEEGERYMDVYFRGGLTHIDSSFCLWHGMVESGFCLDFVLLSNSIWIATMTGWMMKKTRFDCLTQTTKGS